MHVGAGLEEADHRPVAVPEANRRTDPQAGELLGGLPAHDHLAHATLEAPPADHLELVANREGRWLHTAEWYIVELPLALAWQIHHQHQLSRRERTPPGVTCDSG